MKKLLIVLALLAFNIQANPQTGWSQKSQQDSVYDQLMADCNAISLRCGGNRSSGTSVHIFNYLRQIGTPTSLRVLEEQVRMGRVPKSFLSNT